MQKIALSLSITLLAIAILFIGVVFASPNVVKGIMEQFSPSQEEAIVVLEDFGNSNDEKDSNNGSSVWILGDTIEIEPTPTLMQPRQQTYQSPVPLPTTLPTQEPTIQQAQEQKLPWDGGFANKEAYCKDVANKSMAEAKLNPPSVDQSNLPPELRVTINWDVWWSGLFQDCMDYVRNY